MASACRHVSRTFFAGTAGADDGAGGGGDDEEEDDDDEDDDEGGPEGGFLGGGCGCWYLVCSARYMSNPWW